MTDDDCMRDFQANRDYCDPSKLLLETIANALFGRYDLAPQLATVSNRWRKSEVQRLDQIHSDSDEIVQFELIFLLRISHS
jgi:hypothetical protein